MHSQRLTIPAFNIIGIAVKTSNQQCQQDIPALWLRFVNEALAEEIPHRLAQQEVLALYTDYQGDYTQPYTYIIGCKVSQLDTVPPGMIAKTIPAAEYVVFTAQGEMPEGIIQTWQHIWQTNLKRSYRTDFEVYDKKSQGFTPYDANVEADGKKPPVFPLAEVDIHIGIDH